MTTLNTPRVGQTVLPAFKGDSPPSHSEYGSKLTLPGSSVSPFLADVDFLFPYLNHLHSIIVVGSAAHDTQTEGSDLDFVVIAKEKCVEKICEAVFENDIEKNLAGTGSNKLDITVLSESQIEELFSMASPFAFAIRYGTILFDDDYLATLRAKPNPRVPIRKYYTKSLFEKIACQYFCVVTELEKEVRHKSCDSGCCDADASECSLLPIAILPKLIFRMLYLTLPCHGLMPLSRDDAIAFAETFYSSEVSTAVRQAAALIRNKNDVIPYPVYRSLKLAAVKLFREILEMLGYHPDVRQIVHDAANCIRGNFTDIKNSQLKKCFV